MSLLSKLTESELGLKGQDIPKRDGKVESTIGVESTELGLKGKTPETYQNFLKNAGISADLATDLTGENI